MLNYFTLAHLSTVEEESAVLYVFMELFLTVDGKNYLHCKNVSRLWTVRMRVLLTCLCQSVGIFKEKEKGKTRKSAKGRRRVKLNINFR